MAAASGTWFRLSSVSPSGPQASTPRPRPRAIGISILSASRWTLGRPLADRVRLHNLKELRPGSAGRTEIRILYIFDPQRQAVLLVAGDKAGRWTRWYDDAIKLAEERYDRYLATPPEEIR
jgi:hypothetical protein